MKKREPSPASAIQRESPSLRRGLSRAFGRLAGSQRPLERLHKLEERCRELEASLAERANVERELRESEARYRRVADHAYDVIAETDAAGRFLYINSRIEEVTGYKPEELIGRPSSDLVHPDDREELARAFQAMITSGVSRKPVFRSLHSDGSWRWVESTASVFTTGSGEARAVVISRDVSERRRYEEELRLANERLQTLITNSPVILFSLDRDGVITSAVGRSLEEAEFRSEDVIGRTYKEILENDPRVCALVERALSGEELVASLEYRHRWYETHYTPVRDDSGAVQGVTGVSTDITRRVLAEREHKALEEKLQLSQKLESLGMLAGGIAHDFNNLLTSVVGHADLALADLPAESPVRRSVSRIREAGWRAVELTSQMLAYAGRGHVEIQALDLSAHVESLAHLLEVSVSKKSVMRCDLADNLPAIEGDASQLSQVILNLITNASEALEDQEGEITLRTGVLEADQHYLSETYLAQGLSEGRYVYLEVSDTGIGMDESVRSRIFDPFFTTKFTGRGLGLAVLLGIVRAHRGTVRVQSKPQQGTTFQILFPAGGILTDREPAEASEPGEWRGRGTIVVVDDEADVRDVAKAMLPRLGLGVIPLSGAREALDLLRRNGDDIVGILLDVTMPDMGGEEALKEVSQIRPQVPVVLMSGYSEGYGISDSATRGCAGFLRKPFTLDSLREVLRGVLEESKTPETQGAEEPPAQDRPGEPSSIT